MSGREHGHDPAPTHGAPAAAATKPSRNQPPRSEDELEVVPGFERENLQGWIPELATEADIRAVIEKAFDYRGDVTITRKSKNHDFAEKENSAKNNDSGENTDRDKNNYRDDKNDSGKNKENDADKAGSQITGYLFDRRIGKTLDDSFIRLMLATSNDRPAIPYSEIAAIAFTGRDTAAGKSYEAWVKKYWEKRAAGEKNISIEPEALE